MTIDCSWRKPLKMQFRQKALDSTTARTDFVKYTLLLLMVGWLTPLADSKTSLFALMIGIVLVLALQFPKFKRNFWSVLIAIVLVGALSNALFSVQSAVLEASGRDASLTGRTGIWQTVLSEPINPLLGTGYASFWLGGVWMFALPHIFGKFLFGFYAGRRRLLHAHLLGRHGGTTRQGEHARSGRSQGVG